MEESSGARGRASVSLAVPAPVYRRLVVIRAGIEAERGRRVSLGETLEELVKVWEQTLALARDVKEHQE